MRKRRFGWHKYTFCIGLGVVLFLAAEAVDQMSATVENGVLQRNLCGQGDAVYEFYVDGLGESEGDLDSISKMGSEKNHSVAIELQVPEVELSEAQFQELLPHMAELLCRRILGENQSLQEVRSKLELVKELPEYGVRVYWESKQPDTVGADGSIYLEGDVDSAVTVYLEATLSSGNSEEMIEIPVKVYPPVSSREERFRNMLEELVMQNPERADVILPSEFEGQKLYYSRTDSSKNEVLLFLGVVAAVCLFFKEKEDEAAARKSREESLMVDYSDLVYGFLILTGAGYSAKAAWKKLEEDALKDDRKAGRPLYREMQITVNQMETGIPEIRAYAEFGRRCGLRCYMKFASLLESSVSTGGRNLRKLLEDEVEEAFQIRADTARRKGEIMSSKLLLPMFGNLAVVMVMVVAPAFLTLG